MSINERHGSRVTIRSTLVQRIALGALAIFLMLNAVTPFITPDPPWLANLGTKIFEKHRLTRREPPRGEFVTPSERTGISVLAPEIAGDVDQ